MSRPTPRKSLLAGSNPIAPPADVPAKQPDVPPARQPDPHTSVAISGLVGKTPKRTKMSFFIDAEDAGRLRAALIERNSADKAAHTLTDLISAAVMAEVERLERELNNGKHFRPVEPGGIATGRPMGRTVSPWPDGR